MKRVLKFEHLLRRIMMKRNDFAVLLATVSLRTHFLFQLPMLIKDSGLVNPARRWTLDFLKENLLGDQNTVFLSKTKK